MNRDHMTGAAWAACILMLAAAAAYLTIGTFASVWAAQFFAFPGGAGAANAIGRACVALGFISTLGALTLFIVIASPQALWFLVAISGIAVISVTGLAALTANMAEMGLWLIAFLFVGALMVVIGAAKYEKSRRKATMVADHCDRHIR